MALAGDALRPYLPAMRLLYLFCACGHVGSVPWNDEWGWLRDEILPRARCTACGRLGAEEMRLIWKQGGE